MGAYTYIYGSSMSHALVGPRESLPPALLLLPTLQQRCTCDWSLAASVDEKNTVDFVISDWPAMLLPALQKLASSKDRCQSLPATCPDHMRLRYHHAELDVCLLSVYALLDVEGERAALCFRLELES